jgi:hypothetical protein
MAFADLLARVDRAVLGHLKDGPILYAPASEAAITVDGVFDAQYQAVQGPEAGVVSATPAVFLLLADLRAALGADYDPEDDEPTVTCKGVAYRVREPRKDGMGGVVLMLQELDA